MTQRLQTKPPVQCTVCSPRPTLAQTFNGGDLRQRLEVRGEHAPSPDPKPPPGHDDPALRSEGATAGSNAGSLSARVLALAIATAPRRRRA